VPSLINSDYPGRQEGETLFEFPFDHAVRTQDEAYEHISEKLNSLGYPLLFLSNLKEIAFNISNTDGLYEKKILQSERLGNVLCEYIMLSQQDEHKTITDTLFLFSRKNDEGYSYSVGFFINKDRKLEPRKHKAFCYFSTKVVTGLNFIIHAPFLLNDSREGIQAGVQHNRDMVDLLSKLAADSIVILRDIGQRSGLRIINDDIFDIIPYDISVFAEIDDRETLSFMPFYQIIKAKFKSESLLPTFDSYTSKNNAYWAQIRQTATLFSDKQLAMITGDKNAKWVFSSFGRYETVRKNAVLTEYIEQITKKNMGEEDIIRGWGYNVAPGITASFIESQSIEWLHKFYKWISETKTKTDLIKSVPIFLNDHKKAVAAYDRYGNNILFLPSDNSSSYVTVSKELLDNEDTLEFLKILGISKPSLRDEIHNIIIPKYSNNKYVNDPDDFFKFFSYYKECSLSKKNLYIMEIKNYCFVRSYRIDSDKIFYSQAKELYYPTKDLLAWFKTKPSTLFLRWSDYVQLYEGSEKEFFTNFLSELGIGTQPKIIKTNLSGYDPYILNKHWSRSTQHEEWYEYIIDGCEEFLKAVLDSKDKLLSVKLWKMLILIIRSNGEYPLNSRIIGTHRYFYRTQKFEQFKSRLEISLCEKPWLLNRTGDFVSADKLTSRTLYSEYDIINPQAERLYQFLGIKFQFITEDNIHKIQEINIAEYGKSLGLSPNEQQQALDQYVKRKNEEIRLIKNINNNNDINYNNSNHNNHNNNDNNINDNNNYNNNNNEHDNIKDNSEEPRINKKNRPTNFTNALEQTAKKISKYISSSPENFSIFQDDSEDNTFLDEDDYSKTSINIKRKANLILARAEKNAKETALLESLWNCALASKKYSFLWFKKLLELELLNSSENNTYSREISISFSKVQLEEGASTTLILRDSNRHIPQSMEDLSDIPLELYFDNQPMVKATIEVVNVQSYTLRAKLKTENQIQKIDLSLVTEARIEAKNPVFLLKELQKAFSELDEQNTYDDEFNMQANLCENLEFVFGPPGTGKTRLLAKTIISDIMHNSENLNMLVLTPTNKAADVLISQIISEMGEDSSYLNWLIRFGTTYDCDIERSGVYHERAFDITTLKNIVTVTTIARFPYDYFMHKNNVRLHLKDMKWDYIIFDEASMIPLVNIVYPLYKQKPKKFIIAGDPFQIQPILSVDIWKNKNIYSMVNLKSFDNPDTIPHKYPVKLLTTQYRSIPEIGELFSQLTYKGILTHNRTSENRRKLNINEFIDIGPLNIIKFPVSKYESIYRPKRLQSRSNYQIYSALFTLEFVEYLTTCINLVNENEIYNIGIITPYRAQADLVDKLIVSIFIPDNINVHVGTIHGFQGDEYDIILALFNPTPKITLPNKSRQMFLNKLNIINVSISRAKDYLFVLMPDDNTENIENLQLLKKVEKLCKMCSGFQEYLSNDLENRIFGSKTYIEDNAFSTSHQLINVYSKPEKKYEIRSEDNAVDIQILK
jgi:hypothetical protein